MGTCLCSATWDARAVASGRFMERVPQPWIVDLAKCPVNFRQVQLHVVGVKPRSVLMGKPMITAVSDTALGRLEGPGLGAGQFAGGEAAAE